MKKLSIETAHEIAKKFNGKCLSEIYINHSVPLEWECKEGHRWQRSLKLTKKTLRESNGEVWCSKCYFQKTDKQRKVESLEEMHKLAESRGGKCLSKTYTNANEHLEWECKEGHRWYAKPGMVKFSSWCRTCAGSEKHTIEEMHQFAESKGWKCISTEYKGNKEVLQWRCDKEHRWLASPNNILRGSNCPRCSGKKILELDDLHELAERRGGKCLSNEYNGTNTHHEWECQQGHHWKAKPNSIQQGSWCPECNFYLSEEKCRFILNKLFKEKFKKTRSIIGRYELDGYNKKLNLAFEYHGIQHFEFRSKFFENYDHFFERKEIDQIKEKMCKEKGINLIIIPYTENNDDENLILFIIKECEKLGYKPPNREIELSSFYKKIPFWDDIHELATKRGGKCLSETFINKQTKMLWECEQGHRWEARLDDVQSGHWCLKCSGKEKLTIEIMHEIAKSKGGKCLSSKYINNKTKLIWQCEKGHIWETAPGHIKNKGAWCKECAGLKKKTIVQMQELAQSKGGKCLSTEYVNANTQLEWECKEGHRWKAKPGAVTFGSWCLECTGKKPLTIEIMHEIAKSKGGKCLSSKYINSKTPLEWECKEGHRWMAIPMSVKNKGAWCQKCSAKERAKRIKTTIGAMKELAISRGGKCLSDKMESIHDKLEWICKEGHIWQAKANNVKNNNSWCKKCHYKNISRMKTE
ncbi:zinc-ribbon domain-containing protein [Priestia aryabhattai]